MITQINIKIYMQNMWAKINTKINTRINNSDLSLQTLTEIVKNNIKKSILFIIIVISLIVSLFTNNDNQVDFSQVKSGNIVESVTVSGQIEAENQSSLAFEKSGRVNNILVKVGDMVTTGQTLANIDSGNEEANIISSKAILSQAEANLSDAINGATPVDIAIKKQAVSSAYTDLLQANNASIDTASTIYSGIFDIINNKFASFFTHNTNTFTLNKYGCDQNLANIIEKQRSDLEEKINYFLNYKNDLSLSKDLDQDNKKIDMLGDIATALARQNVIFIDNLNKLYSSSCIVNNSDYDNLRTIISTNKNTISGIIDIINTSKNKILTYRNTYNVAKLALEQTLFGATDEKIKSLRAQVNTAKASLLLAENNFNKNYLYAPFNGTITAVNIEKGEISSPNTSAITLISDNAFKIKAKLTEIDITKVKVGDDVKITLDAFGDQKVFDGKIINIDPSSTKEGNSDYYYTNININDTEKVLRSGMNAEAKIITNQKYNVLIVNNKYIYVKNGIYFAKVLNNKSIKSPKATDFTVKPIMTGILSTDGNIEIISGLVEGDILYPISSADITDNTDNNSSPLTGEIESRKEKIQNFGK